MELLTEAGTMARPKGRPKKSERDDVAVKVDRAIAKMAKTIGDIEGISVAEVISETVRDPLTKRYVRLLRAAEES
jgi:hypothetical protein